jgi:tRNA-dihydrouridine synthase
MSFWRKIRKSKPIFCLAPMEDVTDTVFRQIVQNCGKPDVMFTEFTNCEGMQSSGQDKLIHRLKFNPIEKPLVAQVWGITPNDYYKTAQLILKMGFDGIDINMGCPVKKIIKQGACSALIQNPTLAKEIYIATKEGVKSEIPVSIKTRIGFNEIQTEDWIGFLLEKCQPEVLTIHGRTVKELSKSENHWNEIGKAVKLKNEIQKKFKEKTLILGNGDVNSLAMAKQKIEECELDGVMIGRAIFHNPWVFNPNIQLNSNNQIININKNQEISKQEKINLLLKHIKLWEREWTIPNLKSQPNNSKENFRYQKNYSELKRFFKIYINGFLESSKLRQDLMRTDNIQQAINILEK